LCDDNIWLNKKIGGTVLRFTNRELIKIKNTKMIIHNHLNSTFFSLDDINIEELDSVTVFVLGVNG